MSCGNCTHYWHFTSLSVTSGDWKGRNRIMTINDVKYVNILRHGGNWNSRHSLDNIGKCTGQLSGMSKYGEYNGVFLGYYRRAQLDCAQ